MADAVTLRLGVRRPDRPLSVVATAEARVIRHELERRLGPVVLDPRVDGDPLGPWQPCANASWPVAIDAEVEARLLWAADLPPLTTLFGRTVDPSAAEVRHRMLTHLGLLPDLVDDAALEALAELPVRPTDLWLIVRNAERIELTEPAVLALAGTADSAPLDAAFDAVSERLAGVTPSPRELLRLRAVADAQTRRAAALADESARAGVEAADRLDELARENEVLRERLARVELDQGPDPT